MQMNNRLKIADGEIVMKDGSDLKAYLTEWQNKAKYGDFDISIVDSDQLRRLISSEIFSLAA